MSVNRILIFDVDALADPELPGRLGGDGIALTLCADVGRALALCHARRYDAIVICLAPARPGMELLENIGRRVTPVLLATAADAVELRLRGLERGAADYLIAPFGAAELRARVDTVRQRAAPELARRRRLSLDGESGRFGDGARSVWLTPTERRAAALLLKRRGRPVGKDELRSALGDGAASESAVGVLMHRLRAKLRPLRLDVRARRGEGYVFEDNREEQDEHDEASGRQLADAP